MLHQTRSLPRALAALVVVGVLAQPAVALAPEAPAGRWNVRGRLTEVRSFRARGHLFTTARVATPAGLRDVVVQGGRVGNAWEFVEGEPRLDPGAQVALDVETVGGLPRVVGGTSTAGEGNGEWTATAAMADGPTDAPGGTSWCYRNAPATFVVEGAVPRTWVRAVRKGFNAWNAQTDAWMRFTYAGRIGPGQTANDGVNRIRFVPVADGDLAKAWVYGEGPQILGFDIEVNADRPLGTRGRVFHLPTVVRHEVGHVLGLGHSESPTSIMFPALAKGMRQSLSAGDLAANRALHPYDDIRGSVVAQTPDPLFTQYRKDTRTVGVVLVNDGYTPWGGPFGGIGVHTAGPRLRSSPFHDPGTWVAPDSPASLTGDVVCRGESVSFTWSMQGPTLTGTYKEEFGLTVGEQWPLEGKPAWQIRVPV